MRRSLSLLVFSGATALAAESAPDYTRDIAPLFEKRCTGCHNEKANMGEYRMETHELVLKGGNRGAAVIPGKSAESLVYLMTAGEDGPPMPLDGTRLTDAEIQLIRTWIDAGASGPGASAVAAKAASQASVPQHARRPQIFATAWHPAGNVIALGGYQEVRLTGPGGAAITMLPGHAETVRALAFSPDGKWLAAAGGLPAKRGEVKIWNVEQRTVEATVTGHDDCIYAVAFSPDGKLLATASYDKLIRLWDPATGAEVRTLKDHIDAVYALAFTPDGKRLVSGSADRTVKIWDPQTGKRLYTLSESTDGVNAIAIDPAGKLVAAGGLDKSIRIWSLGATGGTLLQSLMAHEDAILRLAWSPDGKTLVSSAADRTIKVLQAGDLTETRSLANQTDWVYGLAYSPDGRTVAAGRFDGSLSLYDSNQFQDTAESGRVVTR